MKRWVIEGGRPLRGRVTVRGAKNVAFKLMIAALLGEDETILDNVPDVGDVDLAGQMIRHLGGCVEHIGSHQVRIDPQGLSGCSIPPALARQSRASFMFVGPLLARFKEASLPLPGGDRIGRRPLDRHVQGLQALGARIRKKGSTLHVSSSRLQGAQYHFPKNTHTGTETLILASVTAKGRTQITNSAEEPEVLDLIDMLNNMGAQIKRERPRTLVIEGVDRLHGTHHTVLPDRNAAVSFSCMALATRGEIIIQQIQPKTIDAFLEQLEAIGAGFEVGESSLKVWYKGALKPTRITTAPHPGFMSDWQPLLTTLLTQAHGTSVLHETVFESRFGHVEELRKMGANITLFNPAVKNPDAVYNFNLQDDRSKYFHAARIEGPTPLNGVATTVKDVRAGATLVQAALTARGQTTLSHVERIERGYEHLDQQLRRLGAKIESQP
ncbi:MAG: UDP-N-acetylglucosamine 1-carboxyvinyltransferase [bacterium]